MTLSLRWILGLILIATLLLVVGLFQQGGLLRTGVYPTAGILTSEPIVPEPDTFIPPAALVYCEKVKQGHIQDCGMMAPEEDFTCRTEEADVVYQDCLTTATPEDLAPYEEPAVANTQP